MANAEISVEGWSYQQELEIQDAVTKVLKAIETLGDEKQALITEHEEKVRELERKIDDLEAENERLKERVEELEAEAAR